MDETILKTLAESELRHYGVFLHKYDNQLEIYMDRILNMSNLKTNAIPMGEFTVKIDYSSHLEQLSLLNLLGSDRFVYKTIKTFAHLYGEAGALIKDAQFLQAKFQDLDKDFIFSKGDDINDLESRKQSKEVLLKISGSIELLYHIQYLVQRCITVGTSLLHQFAAYVACSDINPHCKLFKMFDCIFDLLLQIIIFDEIFLNSNFLYFWSNYKISFDAFTEKDVFQPFLKSEVNGMQNYLQKIDNLFSGTLFQNFLESTITLRENMDLILISSLQKKFSEYLKYNLDVINKFEPNDLIDMTKSHLLVRANSLCVVFHTFCGQIEAKYVKYLMELNEKNRELIFVDNIPWSAPSFLMRHVPMLVQPYNKLLQNMLKQSKGFLLSHIHTLERDLRTYSNQILVWTLNIQKAINCSISDFTVDQFEDLAKLLLLGLRYAAQISFLVKFVVNSHVVIQAPMKKRNLLYICKLIELLKTVQFTFRKYSERNSTVIHCIIQYMQYKLLCLLLADKENSSRLHFKLETLLAFRVAGKCLNGPPTKKRMLITSLAIDASNFQSDAFHQYKKCCSIMQRIEVVTNLEFNLNKFCETSFLHRHQLILHFYLQQIVRFKMDFHSFQHILSRTNCKEKHFDLNLNKILRNEIKSNVYDRIETFLRLEVHTSLQLEQINLFDLNNCDYRDLVNLYAFDFNGNYTILKGLLEKYLSAMFYNLTTLSLCDWKSYAEMRHVAKRRLLLKTIEDCLPNQTTEQGIDVLQIMHTFHVFISTYVYNMNSQIFLEQRSASKHIDSIGIRHMSNSMQTYGAGVINTTINFTYQFLRQKFSTFSQFLYDEQIKSRLMKDLHHLSERKKNNAYSLYTYEISEAFNKDIRKLGLSPEGETYMDLFRKVITHIGNAIGFIRLVRSGYSRASYSAGLYLPRLDEHRIYPQNQLNVVTSTSANKFNVNVYNLTRNFSHTKEYFKLLLKAFQPFFRNPRNIHLKYFFLIIPPLTLNYVEHILSLKMRIQKKDRQENVVFDDGFALGLAYILNLLQQVEDLNSLHWFDAVRERFKLERQKINNNLAKIQQDAPKNLTNTEKAKLQETLALTKRRIYAHEREFAFLYYSINSAKILFQ